MSKCNAGFACISWIFTFVPTIAGISALLTLPILFAVSRLWQYKVLKVLLIIVGISPFILLFTSVSYHFARRNFTFLPAVQQDEAIPYRRLNQYVIDFSNNRNFQGAPFKAEEWQTYTDQENKFSINYPPLLEVRRDDNNSDIVFYFKDFKQIRSTNEKIGNEIAVIKILTPPAITLVEDDLTLKQEFQLNGLKVTKSAYYFYLVLPNKKIIALGDGKNKFNAPYSKMSHSSLLGAMLQTLRIE